MSYIGNNLESDIQVNKYQYTATASQVDFPCTYDRAVDVYVNGLKLAASDFTATDGVKITLASGLNAGDIVDINAYFNITYADSQTLIYNNTTSGLTATTTQNAIDELASEKVDKVTSTDNAVVRFDGTSGHIEFNDGKLNQEIYSFDDYSFLVDLWNLENKKANKPNYWYVWNGSVWIEDFDLKAQEELKSELAKAETYLSRTDWYYARKAETGEDVPADVVAKRIEYREFIRNNS